MIAKISGVVMAYGPTMVIGKRGRRRRKLHGRTDGQSKEAGLVFTK